MFNLHSIFSSCLFMLGGREFQVYHDFLERKHSGTVKLYSGFFFYLYWILALESRQ